MIEWDHVGVSTHLDGKALYNRQRQGKAEMDCGAEAGAAADADISAQCLHVATDHIHADASAGERAHLVGSRQTGFEDQLIDVVVAQVWIHRDSPLFRRAENSCPLQSSAVVFD